MARPGVFEDLPDQLVVAAALQVVLRQHRAALVGPARHRAAEVVGEDGVRDLVRQDAGQQPVRACPRCACPCRGCGRGRRRTWWRRRSRSWSRSPGAGTAAGQGGISWPSHCSAFSLAVVLGVLADLLGDGRRRAPRRRSSACGRLAPRDSEGAGQHEGERGSRGHAE